MKRHPFLVRRLLAIVFLVAIAAGPVVLLWRHPWILLPVLMHPFALGLWPGVWRRRGERLPPAATDLVARRRVWNVLSELYLDTELDERDHERIVSVLLESRYSAEQLEEILYRELHPVLHGNLLSVAGEWSGFREEWLEEQLLQNKPSRASFALIPGKWMVREPWAALEARLRKVGR